MVSEISVVNGTKYITLKTIIDIKNHYIKPVNIWSKSSRFDENVLGLIEPDQTFNVPVDVVYSESCDFFFQIKGEEDDGESVSYESYNWRELMDTPVYSKQIHCTNNKGGPDTFINIEGNHIFIFHKVKNCNLRNFSGNGNIFLIYFVLTEKLKKIF